jgi:hypothetical protein
VNREYRYTLEKGSKKFLCPKCGRKRYVRYRDNTDGNYLPIEFGKCDRVESCTYDKSPYKEGYKSNEAYVSLPDKIKTKESFIPNSILEQALTGYKENLFVKNLSAYPVNEVSEVCSLYGLGTILNGYRKGGCCFPFIDKEGKIRAIQVKGFDDKQHTTYTDYLHSIIDKFYQGRKNVTYPLWLKEYLKNDKYITCLFGEHLLTKFSENPVFLVEAPKTAVYGMLHFGIPINKEGYIWLAVYNLSSITYQKCKVLEGRTVVLIPDLSLDKKAYKLWYAKAQEFQERLANTTFVVSDYLENIGSSDEIDKGADLADFLIKNCNR